MILRVKELRRAILAAMIDGNLDQPELDRRWKHLETAGFAQSLSLYPARYVASKPTAERILETVERFHEHLNGDETAHGPMKTIIQVGEPIQVSPKRDRNSKADALLQSAEQHLKQVLEATATDCSLYSKRTL